MQPFSDDRAPAGHSRVKPRLRRQPVKPDDAPATTTTVRSVVLSPRSPCSIDSSTTVRRCPRPGLTLRASASTTVPAEPARTA